MALELVTGKVDSLELSGVVLMGAKRADLLVYSTVEMLATSKVGCLGFHLTEKMALELVAGKVESLE